MCVNCGKDYDPDTVEFGDCWKHTEPWGRALPDRPSMDHWRNTIGDDEGAYMWLCCKSQNPNNPGCQAWAHCQEK